MVEIEECRYCSGCCGACIFLEIDFENLITGCLIYKNKYRRPIPCGSVEVWFTHYDSQYWSLENKLKSICEESKDICDTHICTSLIEDNQILADIRDDSLYRSRLTVWKKAIDEARKLIPRFEDLVQILNGE